MAIGAFGHPTGYDQPTQSSVSKQKFKNSQSPQDDDFESPPKKPPTKSATQAPEKPPSKAAQSTAKDLGDPDESSEPRKAARKSRKKNNHKKLSDESKGKEKEKSIKKKKKKRKPKKKSGQRDAPSDSDDEDGKWGVGQVKGVLVIKILTQSRLWGVSKKTKCKKTMLPEISGCRNFTYKFLIWTEVPGGALDSDPLQRRQSLCSQDHVFTSTVVRIW
ncbi:hypothetical protein D6D04_01776 [Aureobasidium pullulans]|nr:hypothetical protein D6D04_01776 [Aureobasidium pullulans]